MEPPQSFCNVTNQSLPYARLDGSVQSMMLPENGSNGPCNSSSKAPSSRSNRSYGQSPYCCPSSTQQSKLLYNLLSSWPKDSSEQLSCMPIIEHQPVCHQTAYNGTSAVALNAEPTGSLSSNPPPFKFDFKGQLVSDLMPILRQRSQSMGSNGWNMFDMSRTSSHDSLASYDSISDENLRNHSPSSQQQQSEVLLEVTRKKLMNLLMGGKGNDQQQQSPASRSPPMDPNDNDMRSLSQPGSPSSLSSQEVCRKYSEGSRRVHLKAKLQSARARYDYLPVDLSLRRKKFITGMRVPKQSLIEGIEAEILPDEGIDESLDHSILKSVLTGRGRSNSLSVFELRRLRMAGRNSEARNGQHVNHNLADLTSLLGSRLNGGRQRVTLAKKNLLPVIARISDRLHKIVDFAKSLPEFMHLPLSDQRTLLMNACPRLLLLYMAETNLQFAVTTVQDACTLPAAPSCASASGPGVGQAEWEAPTMQFVDYVQNFIRKCQMINISANEYFYMRMITLFHTGAGALERSDLAGVMYSEARQDLQDLVQHSHPNEKLRYSTLLLSLHTLFGIHCGMLQALFCKHLSESGGIGAFITEALSVGSGMAGDAVAAAAAAASAPSTGAGSN